MPINQLLFLISAAHSTSSILIYGHFSKFSYIFLEKNILLMHMMCLSIQLKIGRENYEKLV